MSWRTGQRQECSTGKSVGKYSLLGTGDMHLARGEDEKCKGRKNVEETRLVRPLQKKEPSGRTWFCAEGAS